MHVSAGLKLGNTYHAACLGMQHHSAFWAISTMVIAVCLSRFSSRWAAVRSPTFVMPYAVWLQTTLDAILRTCNNTAN